jgi:hypothetical protein
MYPSPSLIVWSSCFCVVHLSGARVGRSPQVPINQRCRHCGRPTDAAMSASLPRKKFANALLAHAQRQCRPRSVDAGRHLALRIAASLDLAMRTGHRSKLLTWCADEFALLLARSRGDQVQSRCPGRTGRSRWARRTSRTDAPGSARRTRRSGHTDGSLKALVSLRPRRTVWTSGPLRPLRPLRPLLPLWTFKTSGQRQACGQCDNCHG